MFHEKTDSRYSERLSRQADIEEDLRKKRILYESHVRLQNDFQDLNDTVKQIDTLVHAQGESVDTIEQYLEEAVEKVEQGNEQLSKAAKLKRAIRPVTCAMVGTAVAGPVGALFGLKIAIGSAIASAFIGYKGAKLVQNKSSIEYEDDKES